MSGRHRKRDARRKPGWHPEMRGAELVLVGHGLIAIFGAHGELYTEQPITTGQASAIADAYLSHLNVPLPPPPPVWTPFTDGGQLAPEVREHFHQLGALTDEQVVQ